MPRDVNTKLLHGSNGFGPNNAWVGAHAFHVEFISGVVAQQAFGHLAAGRIAGAENENALFHGLTRLSCANKPAEKLPLEVSFQLINVETLFGKEGAGIVNIVHPCGFDIDVVKTGCG